MTIRRPPIAIVGGGPSGLLLSNLLSLYRIPSILFERQSTAERFAHPQAHFLNTRSMEILRYWLPDVHGKVQAAMPDVYQWSNFCFGHSLSAEPLAIVRHLVDRPLVADCDANGVLQEDWVEPNSSSLPLSPCSVGHLAQHTFCRILYDSAVATAAAVGSEVRYGEAVESVDRGESSARVQTKSGVIEADLVVAADGAHSALRQAAGIGWHGQEAMQHLMNIHVTIDHPEVLHAGGNAAMLYSIFNEHCVAMVVCHSWGDYIIQIPYFPPYQTPQEDFADDKLHEMVRAIFGPRVSSFQIQSARPWCMSSMLADTYVSNRLVLAGDAAHVLPPAGGFGMNTGLQDVHNLAWRLAQGQTLGVEDWTPILTAYSTERRRVAAENAALSVRNYRRLLEVNKACYLNEQHPSMLKALLDQSPLPLAVKKGIFRSSFAAALLPLRILSQEEALYTRHLKSNLRSMLQMGAGLPLLFPRYEMGFSYGKQEEPQSASDTWADQSQLVVGKLVPHTCIKVVSPPLAHPNLLVEQKGLATTANLPAQVANTHEPTWVLLVVGSTEQSTEQIRAAASVPNLAIVQLQHSDQANQLDGILVVREDMAFFARDETYWVLIRPDSHVAGIGCMDSLSEVNKAARTYLGNAAL